MFLSVLFDRQYMAREQAYIYMTTVDTPVLHHGKGVMVTDVAGKECLDFTSQICLLNTGYSPPEIVKAIEFTAKRLHSCISADFPFCFEFKGMEISRAALARELIDLSDSVMPSRPKKVLFEVSGATAVNAAAMLAMISHRRKDNRWSTDDLRRLFFDGNIFSPWPYDPFSCSFLAFKRAFHGRHGLAKLLTNSKPVHLWGTSASCSVGRLTFPKLGMSRKAEEITREADEIIKQLENRGPVIAFFFEPVQGEGGINVPDPEGLSILINHLRGRGIRIIADEIQSGLGRTGTMLACEQLGIQPDMILLSKSLGAGLPLGALIADTDLFPDLETGMHSGSMHCTPLACAAGLANLRLIRKNLKNAEKMGEYAGVELVRIWRDYKDIIQEVRGLGLMIGIEFHTLEQRKTVLKKCKENGLLLAGCGEKTIRFYPPITVKKKELNSGLEKFRQALQFCASGFSF